MTIDELNALCAKVQKLVGFLQSHPRIQEIVVFVMNRFESHGSISDGELTTLFLDAANKV